MNEIMFFELKINYSHRFIPPYSIKLDTSSYEKTAYF